MKLSPTMFLRAAIVFVGLVVLAMCAFVLYPGLADAGPYGPVVWGVFASTVPFYIALYQAMKLLRFIDTNKAFSTAVVKALQIIKFCALAISALYTVGLPYIYFVADYDDAPGVLVFGILFAFTSTVIALFTAVMQKVLQSAIAIKSENDLTV